MDGTEPEFNPVMERDEDLVPFDVHESSERAGLIKLAIGFGILLALAFIVMKLYQPGTRARTDPPLITAENTPFKVVPEDVGGTQTPDQDKEVFEIMSGKAPETDVVTLPAPEVPITVPKPAERDPVPAETPVAETPPAETPKPATPKPATPKPKPATNVLPEQPVKQAGSKVVTQPQTPVKAPITGGSDWVVQIASLRTQAEADRTFADVQARFPAILSGYGADIRRVDLAEKGIYYRTRVSGFLNKGDASATCDRLKAAGQACFVTKR